MSQKPIKLLSLAAALAALSGTATLLPPPADAKPSNPGNAEGTHETAAARMHGRTSS